MTTTDNRFMEKRIGTLKGLENGRATLAWANISEIMPNPLNPRKNDSIKADEMKDLISRRGWEIPLTVYKKGNLYIVLSGHRRLFAARAAGIKQIPVFITDAPKSHQEEIERIASVQRGQVDWEPIEYARFTYERWLAWGRPSVKKFTKDLAMNMSERTVENYITVLDMFPMEEIEAGIRTGAMPFSLLYDIAKWIQFLKRSHAELVGELSQDMVRRLMLEKLQNKKVSRESLRKKDIFPDMKDEDLKEFFFDKSMNLEDLLKKYSVDVTEKSFAGHLVSIGLYQSGIKKLNPKSEEEAKKAAQRLEELQASIRNQIKNIEKKYPGVFENEADLFSWKKK